MIKSGIDQDALIDMFAEASAKQGEKLRKEIARLERDLNHLHRTRSRLPLLRDERTALVAREMGRITNG